MDLEDGRTTVFLNTRGKNESEVPGELVTFLQYMKEAEGRKGVSRSICGAVTEVYPQCQGKPGDGGTLYDF